MKKIFFMFMMILLSFLFLSCDKQDVTRSANNDYPLPSAQPVPNHINLIFRSGIGGSNDRYLSSRSTASKMMDDILSKDKTYFGIKDDDNSPLYEEVHNIKNQTMSKIGNIAKNKDNPKG